ncbi:MAG: domain S-box/diguanylate cyclase protein [Friedmanniella sp.]|nr:domain S-box/diguanylate cyclase protein [Friedmanniella sp.]
MAHVQGTLPSRNDVERVGPAVDQGVSVAVLDQAGVIVAVNQVWVDFCLENGGRLDTCGPGASYLEACLDGGDAGSEAMATAILDAIRGDGLHATRLQIACHAPYQRRWFDVVVSSALAPDARTVCGATVMLAASPGPQSADVATSRAELTAELHDGIIREVFGSTLSICSVLDLVTDPLARERIHQGVDTLDQALARLRRIAVELEQS